METKHNIIRRALEQAPGTPVAEGFCVRLMERLERESERRERRETWLLGTAGVLCLLAVIAGLAWYLWYEPGVGLHLPDIPSLPDIPALPGLGSIQLPEPDFPAESRRLSLFYVLYRRDVPRPRRARPLPAQAQAQCRENKRTPAPINRAHRATGADSGHAEHSRPSFGMHRPLSAAVRYQTADPPQRMDSDQQTADGGQWAEGRGL